MRRTHEIVIGDVLKDFFERPYVKYKVAEGKLPDTWREVVGERAAAVTSSIKLENHILYVHITSAIIRSELFLRRDAIAAAINQLSGVRLVNVLIVK